MSVWPGWWAASVLAVVLAGPALAAEKPYTVGNYPVEAAAANAVAAKERALAEGRQAAFRSLLKRLVPVTAYKRLGNVKREDATALVEGVAVRSERTSATQYIASLDFSFQPQAVRDLLRREGIPLVDEQSPRILLLPVYAVPAADGAAAAGPGAAQAGRAWREAWSGLDLDNALTPIKIDTLKPAVTPATLAALKAAEEAALATVARSYAADFLVLALAEPDPRAQRLNVTLAGRDAVSSFALTRSYRLSPDDFAYTAELAAVIALGTLEGRWKAHKQTSTSGGAGAYAAAPELVQLTVEFRNMQQWQEMRRLIAGIEGVEDIDVAGLSARTADMTVSFPGGEEALVPRLMAQGLQVHKLRGGILVRPAI